MAGSSHDQFSKWLDEKLRELNTDESVFGSYITGILDSDETAEEKQEALEGILSEILTNEEDISKICNEILDKWEALKSKEPPPQALSTDDMNDKLAKLLESQSLATTKQKQYTAEEKKIKDAILSQYGQMTDSEEEDDDVQGAAAPAAAAAASGEPKENGLEKNLNFQTVQRAEKDKREQARMDSQKKKEKDREDREKQKQLKEDKKEKRKTQKGERRR
ncbi:unnamed protein product [Brassicogethes aeneus]|uniref:Coiled-coil domain-containing protein 43 n=1 Tax=Brassicogethes aeneus TaxID=1431903 RepID=A0A9P0FJ05_BRAAE|nr:unnamed protein product [Brassicogethes aeneus]